MSDTRKLKSRRSSILKPPKPRNPLSDVDLNPPSDTTIMKSRRVSFANVHFKKEFTADPEKNTIWHTSYEEEMNKSDHSEVKISDPKVASNTDINMSVEDMSLDSDIMNCTHVNNLDTSLEAALANNSCDTSIISATIDLTEHHNKKVPMISTLQSHIHFQEVEQHSFVLPSNEVVMKMTQTVDSGKENDQVHSSRPDLDLTVPVPPIIYLPSKLNKKTINLNTNLEDGNMDITQAATVQHKATKRQTIHFTNETDGATMEFTQSVPSYVVSNVIKRRQTQNRQSVNFKTNSECENIDITQAVSSEIVEKENQHVTKRQTIYFTNETEGATLELTQSVPSELLSNLIQQKKRQTINFKSNAESGNMDITQGLTAEIAENENQCTTKRQTMHFNNETEGANMEITQSVAPELLSNMLHQQKRQTINFKPNTESGNMDITQGLTAEFAEKENQFTTKRQTMHFNNETEGAIMEFTQSVPRHLLSSLIQQKKRHTIHFKSNSESGNMDITQGLTAEIAEKENLCMTKRQTMHFNDETEGATMEITQSVAPELLPNLLHQQKRQTINFKTNTECGNMDITQGLTSEIAEKEYLTDIIAEKENQYTRKRQTMHFNKETEGATMEITQSVPPQLLSNLIHQQKRQTINFKTNIESGNMDITQDLTAEIAEKEYPCTTKRQTMHFNNETEGATIEFTQSVPHHLLSNLIQQKKRHTINFKSNAESGNMDITQGLTAEIAEKENQCTRKRQTMHFNDETEGATMEITQSVAPELLSNLLHQQKRQTTNFKTNTECGNMDITQGLTAEIAEKENQFPSKRQTMHFNNETEGANMEITQSVPPQLLSNLLHQKKRQTINFKPNTECGNMDITQDFTDIVAEKENQCKTKRQTMHFNNETEGATMEITHSVPPQLLSNLNHQQKRQTINFKTNIESGNMDITQGVIAEKENQCPTKRQTMHFNNETEGAIIEFTQSVAPEELLSNLIQQNKHQTFNSKANTDSGKMDITQGPTAEIAEKENHCPTKRQTMHFNNETDIAEMEITQSVPSNMHYSKNKDSQVKNQKRQTNNYQQQDEAVEEDQCIRNRDTMHFNNKTEDATMEFTQSHVSLKLNNDRPRQTINIENNLEGGTMNLTQAVLNEVSEKENECTERQTMHFNNETQRATIELTQPIPSQLYKDCQRKTMNLETNLKDTETNIRPQNDENDIKGTINRQTIHFITDTEGATIEVTQFTPEQTLYNQTSSTGSIEIIKNNVSVDSIQKKIQINKVIQDTLSFTNIHLENDSALIKTVDAYFSDSSEQKTETLDKTQDSLPAVDIEIIQSQERVQPIILDQNSSDICQRIKLPGQTDDYNVSNVNLSDKIDLTPVQHHDSFNLTEDITRILENTNKLINCESGVSVSEYSKIISDDIADMSFPEISDATDNSKNMSNNLADSIISVNSSIEIEKSVEMPSLNEIDVIMKDIELPPKYDDSFNLKEELAKLPKVQSTNATSNELRTLLAQPSISLKKRLKMYFDIDMDRFKKEKNDTQTLVFPQYQYEDKRPKKMYQKFEELVKKRNLVQEEKEQSNKKPTLEDKIKRMINKNTLWNLIPNEEFSFTFMGNSIKFIAQVDRASQVVEHVEFFPQIDESTCRPIWIYIHRIQRVKLSQDQIKSAIGQNYTIFSLLDYLTKIGEELMDILQEYDHLQFNIGVKLDRCLNAILLFTNLPLRLAFEVTINLNSLDNMTGDLISVKNLVGSSDENALKRLIKHCPLGFSFFREYDRLVKDYLKVLQQSRLK